MRVFFAAGLFIILKKHTDCDSGNINEAFDPDTEPPQNKTESAEGKLFRESEENSRLIRVESELDKDQIYHLKSWLSRIEDQKPQGRCNQILTFINRFINACICCTRSQGFNVYCEYLDFK